MTRIAFVGIGTRPSASPSRPGLTKPEAALCLRNRQEGLLEQQLFQRDLREFGKQPPPHPQSGGAATTTCIVAKLMMNRPPPCLRVGVSCNCPRCRAGAWV